MIDDPKGNTEINKELARKVKESNMSQLLITFHEAKISNKITTTHILQLYRYRPTDVGNIQAQNNRDSYSAKYKSVDLD